VRKIFRKLLKVRAFFCRRHLGTSIANSLLGAPSRFPGRQRSVQMTMFDPFESDRSREQRSCICGRHRSQAEHDYAGRLTLECAPVDDRAAREEKRFAGVVAQRAMRAAFGGPPRR
jgi:hypothetical protein